METCLEYTDKTMWVSSDQQKIINRILKLKDLYPDKVDVQRLPEQNDGCIYATCPAEWIRISPPRAVNMSDEQKAETAERLKKAREEKAEREGWEKAEQTKTEQAKAEQGGCKAESGQETVDVPAIIANAYSSNQDAIQILFGAHNSIKCTP